MKCPKCGSRDIDFQEAGGQSICVNCGTVLEENTIVSSIEFQETGDRSHVIGQYVAANCSKPFSGGSRMMGRHGDSRNTRDSTLLNAKRSIALVASSLRLPPLYVDRAYRLYQLALQRNFIFGRRQTHVVATCLYIVCRQEKSPHLLIDFSDSLQVNVFILGKSFLQLTRELNISLTVVDPSLYLHRYAIQLSVGEKLNSIVITSLRIITRLTKDWIVLGRRPDGICAASLLIAARAYNVYVTQLQISQLFRISTDTLRKRLAEFAATPSAQLSLSEFHSRDIDLEFDPPSFVKNLIDSSESVDFIPITGTGSESNEVVSFGGDVDEHSVLVLGDGAEISLPRLGVDSGRKKNVISHQRNEERTKLYLDITEDIHSQSSQSSFNSSQSTTIKTQHKLIVSSAATTALDQIATGDDDFLYSQQEQSKRNEIWIQTFGAYMEERERRKRGRDKTSSSSATTFDPSKQSRSGTANSGEAAAKIVASRNINYEALKVLTPIVLALDSKPKGSVDSISASKPPLKKEKDEEEDEEIDEEEDDGLLYEQTGVENEFEYDDYY